MLNAERVKGDILEMNMPIKPMKGSGNSGKFDNRYFRLILHVAFSLAAVAFILRRDLTAAQKVPAGMLTVTFIVLLLEGCYSLWRKVNQLVSWHIHPIKRLSSIIISISSLTAVATYVFFLLCNMFFKNDLITNAQLIGITAVMTFWNLMIAHFYETASLIQQSADAVIKKEQLERVNTEIELQALRSQIDPHFILNSLNTLSYLITSDPQKATIFNNKLADFFRYILVYKNKKLVTLKDELDFIKDYFLLLKIRFENAIVIDINVDADKSADYLIPPISLQILLENAVKHNRFSDSEPLLVTVCLKDNRVVLSNTINHKNINKYSPKTGLHSLIERFRHVTGILPEITENENYFSVSLALINI